MAGYVATVQPVTIRRAVLANNSSQCTVHLTVSSTGYAPDVLAGSCDLSKIVIKDAMQKGAVWLRRPGNKEIRIRKAKFPLQPGDRLSLYYDSQILNLEPLLPRLIKREKHFSVWYKPANLLTQGSRYGDHCSLLRFVEKHPDFGSTVRLVHRLDREAQGLVLLAHGQKSAGLLAELFRTGQIEKRYWSMAHGAVGRIGEVIKIATPLDGKTATTQITVQEYREETEVSILEILLITGRKHQIRRHLSQYGHPVVGDRRYGQVGTGPGLQLCAVFLAFTCPLSGKKRSYSIEPPKYSSDCG